MKKANQRCYFSSLYELSININGFDGSIKGQHKTNWIQFELNQLIMELFKNLKSLGMEPNQKSLFSTVNVIALIMYTYCSCAMIAFVICEPDKSFFDLGNVFFGVVCQTLNTSTLLSNLIKKGKIFELIESFEKLIKKSVYQFLCFF